MTYTIYTVNNNGLEQIKNILINKHKDFEGTEPTAQMLNAWVSDVEDSLHNGNGACFEILSWNHVLGRTEQFTLTTEGYDTEEVEED